MQLLAFLCWKVDSKNLKWCHFLLYICSMLNRLKKAWPFFKNKYILTFLAFLVWIAFFDRNDFYSQYTYRQKLKKLQADKQYYLDEIAKDDADLKKLTTDPKNLEKFAREKYLMKKDNEDIFVVVKE